MEHYRNLWNFVRVLHEKEEDGSNICNNTTCPRMSAGASVTVSIDSLGLLSPTNNDVEITPSPG